MLSITRLRVTTAGVALFDGARGATWSSRTSPQRPLQSLLTAKPHVQCLLHRGAAPGGTADGQTVSKLECHRALYSYDLLGALPGSPALIPPAAVRELPRVCDQCLLHWIVRGEMSIPTRAYARASARHINCQTAPIDSSGRAGPSGDTHSSLALLGVMALWPRRGASHLHGLFRSGAALDESVIRSSQMLHSARGLITV
jgi:hypothetical protein